MFCNFIIKMFKLEGCMWLLRGRVFGKGRMGRAEVVHTSGVTHQQPCFARALPKNLGAFVSSSQNSCGPAPSKCEFLVKSTWRVETTGWKITTASGEH